MKILLKILSIFILTFMLFLSTDLYASIPWLNSVQDIWNITNNSLNIDSSWTIEDNVEKVWFSILTTVKYILSWVLILFIVYAWVQMVLSMWTNEDQLSTSKRQLWYTLIWLVFINIPWSIYNMFLSKKWQIDWWINWSWSNEIALQNENVFINTFFFEKTINWWLVTFIEVIIFTIAIFVIILAGIKIMTSRWQEEKITESKNKIIWSIVWLIFIWFIESWQSFIYNGEIGDWANIFETLENLALFFAWPVAIFFLTLAWYYYITANGDEEKVKKAKSIIINTLIATVILLASYAFLKDLITLNV